MELNGKNFDEILDRAVTNIRDEEIEPSVIEEAGRRVWDRLSDQMKSVEPTDLGGRITGCADVQALLPAYRAGRLTDARELLVQDHLRECVACRNEAQGTRRAVILPWRDAAGTAKGRMPVTRKMAI